MANPLILLIGPQGIGKTTLCLRLAEQFTAHRKGVAGIVTELAGSRRYVLDLTGGERKLLAAAGEPLLGPRWGRYAFSQETLDWGNSVVAQAVAGRADLVILDEVGPLELVAGEGFLPALRAIVAADEAGLVVVRPALVDEVNSMVGTRSVMIWEVTVENRGDLPGHILHRLLGTVPIP